MAKRDPEEWRRLKEQGEAARREMQEIIDRTRARRDERRRAEEERRERRRRLARRLLPFRRAA